MKKQTFATVIVLLLLSSIAVSYSSTAETETDYPALHIISPKVAVYHNSTIDVLVAVHKLVDQPYPLITKIMYSLNGPVISTYKDANFTYNGTVTLSNNLTAHEYIGRATLEDLKEGNYTLRVLYGYGNNSSGWLTGSSVNFRIMYRDYEPATLLSPTNKTYHSSEVPLTLTIYEPYVYAYYCLNGGKPNFINETTSTISELPLGSNNLLVFVKFSDIYSDFRVDFTVDSSYSFDSQDIEFIIIGIAVLAIMLFAVAFLIKRKKTAYSK